MSPESCEGRLEEVLAGYLVAEPDARGAVREDLLRRHPDLAEDLRAFFDDHDRMRQVTTPLRKLLSGGRRDVGATEGALPSPGLQVGAYELLEELGRGGMGVVYKARHLQLGRVVALKMILTGPWGSPAEVRRLRAEAEAVAALDHPNIVPLYEVGEHDGQPYFTMKLIEGATLASAAAALRTGSGPNCLAALVATIARGVHHAHERGILHRDLKPANVLLDREGKPHLTDFGLARRLGGVGLTHSGVTVGTPSYIAPEQASGRSHAVTTAADVYGLGAILYEMLTGGPPFRGSTSLDVLRQVLEEEPSRPSALDPAVPRDLETICLKCLNKEPSRRYASALDLAADLDAYLRGEPIQARPVGGVERLVRWCRRQPVVAGLVLALAVSLVVGFVTTFVQWRRAERHLTEVQEERAREEESFQQAHRAVNEFGSLLREELAHVPGVQGVRKKSLELTRAYLEDFLRRRGEEATLRSELAEARMRLAGVMGDLNANPAAQKEAEKALGLYEELLRANPGDPTLRRQRATAQSLVARLQAEQGESAPALAGYRRAAALYEGLARDRPDDVEVRSGLARVANNVGSLHHAAGRRGEALKEWQKAGGLYEALAREQPSRVGFRLGLAQALHNLAVLHLDEGRQAEALKEMRRSCELQRKLVKEYPQSLEFRHGLAVELHHLSMELGTVGKKAEARQAHQESLDLRERLARENPEVVAYQLALAASCMRHGVLLGDERRSAEALASFRRASAILKEQARRDPARTQIQLDLCRSYFSTAYELARSRQRPSAIKEYQAARDVAEKLLESSPDFLDAREQLVLSLNNLALLQGEEGRHDEARGTARRAVEEARRLAAAAPQTVRYRRQLGGTFSALGKVELDAGRRAGAFEAVQERARLWPNDGRELVAVTGQLALTASAVGRGKAALSPEEQEERLRYLEAALGTLQQALASGYKDFARLRKASDLAILRRHPGFEETLRKFERAP